VTTAKDDIKSDQRKSDHIELAFKSRIASNELDSRFYYEPMLAAHPKPQDDLALTFLGKKLRFPIWVSSMTGGTALAGKINRNLAKACKEFGLGMGLGSCRMLLESDTYLGDFKMRNLIGDEVPFYG
jgi:isopentenyl-diphosphate delta-isomerase